MANMTPNDNIFDTAIWDESKFYSYEEFIQEYNSQLNIDNVGLEVLDINKTSQLKQLLLEKYNLVINRKHILDVMQYSILYELRDTHPEVFNTPLLGVTLAHFLPKDQSALFGIFETDQREFERDIARCGVINKDFKVISDSYNIFSMWVAHCIIRAQIPENLKQDGMNAVFKLLQYKFFTSVVNYNLPHKANIDVMRATIDGLSLKYDIKKPDTSTWRTLIEARSRDIIHKGSIHYNTLDTFVPDGKVLYIISDIQTRLRSNLVRIIQEYYSNKEKNNRINSYSMVDEIDGEKLVKSLDCSYDVMIENINAQVLNTARFIRHDFISIVCKLSTNIRPDMVRDLLTKFSDLAVVQYQQHEQKLVIGTGSSRIYVGYSVLISEIIQKTYRMAIMEKINLKSKLDILARARDLYRSSRIGDENILVIKNSVDAFVNKYSGSNRESTNASLKIAFLLYCLLLSFDYLG